MANGHEAYAVGGCVRDSILGRVPGDWDITTSASPMEVKAIFKRTIDTGIQHGTVTVMLDKEGFEVTTYRIDGEYEDSRHPKEVKFTKNLVEDLKRRDFTINAMAYNPVTGLVDEFEGEEDLEEKIIRCVGVAEERFGEDALRILRAVRFSAQLGFDIEESTRLAATKLASTLKNISRERILTELTKLLISDNPDYIKELDKLDIKNSIFTQEIVIDEITLAMLKHVRNDKMLRFAAFLQEEGTATKAKEILRGLKADNNTTDTVTRLTKWLRVETAADKVAVRKAVYEIGEDIYSLLLEAKRAYFMAKNDEKALHNLDIIESLYEEITGAGDCITLKQLAISGNDLIANGLAEGRMIGEVLKYLLNIVHEDPSKNKKEELITLAGTFTAAVDEIVDVISVKVF
ncbi:MAG: CCA tRNA nucleotidyltransferase [Lachnospiraceae bacterium]|nr:CCA tRNA nucleotidyltransferase [Lachnospiraceae bacterium]